MKQARDEMTVMQKREKAREESYKDLKAQFTEAIKYFEKNRVVTDLRKKGGYFEGYLGGESVSKRVCMAQRLVLMIRPNV
ncbi:hypothetical protein Tco_0798452 [Tanacetum coccineum]